MNKIKALILLSLIIPMSMMAQTKESEKPSETQAYKNLNVDEFEQLLSKHGTILLDVRTAEEFAAGHIEGAINIDVNSSDFMKQVSALKIRKNAKIAVNCRSGRRSANACRILAAEGYKNLSNLSTGILGWIDAGKATTTE